ncbi:hypothetical protein CRG98_032348 [Punica granatum]|uniref:Retrotransposon Copia-like N-terminal domain-containing protein n=1 Tax=Punica granatum TaxID=22663 RepID=A0A2I0ITD9_PUNGR|nr:hypothetical protein CRG98_032348 [Punica granatum]
MAEVNGTNGNDVPRTPSYPALTSSQPNLPTHGNVAIPNIMNLITVQLINRDYTVWKSMFSTFLRSNGLFGMVDGSSSCPPVTNPCYSLWCRLDDQPEELITYTLTRLPWEYESFVTSITNGRDPITFEELRREYESFFTSITNGRDPITFQTKRIFSGSSTPIQHRLLTQPSK